MELSLDHPKTITHNQVHCTNTVREWGNNRSIPQLLPPYLPQPVCGLPVLRENSQMSFESTVSRIGKLKSKTLHVVKPHQLSNSKTPNVLIQQQAKVTWPVSRVSWRGEEGYGPRYRSTPPNYSGCSVWTPLHDCIWHKSVCASIELLIWIAVSQRRQHL